MTNLFARPTNHNCKILSQNQELNLWLDTHTAKDKLFTNPFDRKRWAATFARECGEGLGDIFEPSYKLAGMFNDILIPYCYEALDLIYTNPEAVGHYALFVANLKDEVSLTVYITAASKDKEILETVSIRTCYQAGSDDALMSKCVVESVVKELSGIVEVKLLPKNVPAADRVDFYRGFLVSKYGEDKVITRLERGDSDIRLPSLRGINSSKTDYGYLFSDFTVSFNKDVEAFIASTKTEIKEFPNGN